MTTTKLETEAPIDYDALVRNAEVEMINRMGEEKYLVWRQYNLVALNGKVLWNSKAEYLAMKEELEGDDRLYDQVFLNRYADEISYEHDSYEWLKETEQLRHGG
jgi:hypothetical protein